jgi:hypothetical protein
MTTTNTEDRPAEGGGMGKDEMLAAVGALWQHPVRTQGQLRELTDGVESLFAEVERLKESEQRAWFAVAKEIARTTQAEADRDALRARLDGEAVYYETRVQHSTGEWLDWHPLSRETYERLAPAPGPGRQVRALYAHPPQPVAGDAVERACETWCGQPRNTPDFTGYFDTFAAGYRAALAAAPSLSASSQAKNTCSVPQQADPLAVLCTVHPDDFFERFTVRGRDDDGDAWNTDALATFFKSKPAGFEWVQGFNEGRQHERELATAQPEPVAQQGGEAVKYERRSRPSWRAEQWTSWEECTGDAFEQYREKPVVNEWVTEVRALYTSPIPTDPPSGCAREGEAVAWMLRSQGELVQITDGSITSPDELLARLRAAQPERDWTLTPLYTTPPPPSQGEASPAAEGREDWHRIAETMKAERNALRDGVLRMRNDYALAQANAGAAQQNLACALHGSVVEMLDKVLAKATTP